MQVNIKTNTDVKRRSLFGKNDKATEKSPKLASTPKVPDKTETIKEEPIAASEVVAEEIPEEAVEQREPIIETELEPPVEEPPKPKLSTIKPKAEPMPKSGMVQAPAVRNALIDIGSIDTAALLKSAIRWAIILLVMFVVGYFFGERVLNLIIK